MTYIRPTVVTFNLFTRLSKRNSAGQWSQARVVAAEDGVTHWNPVLFTPDPVRTPDRVILFYKTGTPIPRWKTWMIESADGGETWSPRRELVYGDESGGRGPVKNPVIVGLTLVPSLIYLLMFHRRYWRMETGRLVDRLKSLFPMDKASGMHFAMFPLLDQTKGSLGLDLR